MKRRTLLDHIYFLQGNSHVVAVDGNIEYTTLSVQSKYCRFATVSPQIHEKNAVNSQRSRYHMPVDS